MSNANQASYTLAAAQMALTENVENNRSKVLDAIAEAADNGASVICLQELCTTPYLCQVEDARLFDLAEPIPGPTTEAVAHVAKDKNIAVVVPLFEKRAPGLYHNSIAMIGRDGALLGVYRKMHIPDDPGFYEKYYFTPGDLGFRMFDAAPGKIGTLICWDQWYPEAARLTALQGAEVLVYPTAIGWHPAEKEQYGDQQHDAWRTIQRGHAIANGVFVAAVNRIGLEKPDPQAPGIEFWGRSFICDPFGVVLAEATSDQEEILYAEIDPSRIEDVRRNWPFLRDRRIDAFGGVTQRYSS
ncbi:MAG: carbon-nitrogen hydrolase [Candidatus Hinthialibacter antarcticus]|nr:carbon-nitrogen hydrolase [Candidatus Hinthialibacter antarcticus]